MGSLYIYSEAADEGILLRFTQANLHERLEGRINAELSELINCFSTYTIPCSEMQWTALIFFHEFLVFRTMNFWWSIEKDSQGVHIQMSANEENVRINFHGTRRLQHVTYWSVKERMPPRNPETKTTVHDLIQWVAKFGHLKKMSDVSGRKIFIRRAYSYLSA